MTGFGRGEASRGNLSAAVELRSVNSRFLEVGLKLPRSLAARENDIKEIIRSRASRGKVNVVATVERRNESALPIEVNTSAAKVHYRLLSNLKKTLKLREKISLEHLLHFSEIFEPVESANSSEKEWEVVKQALMEALEKLDEMRKQEGGELLRDLRQRVESFSKDLDTIEQLSRECIPQERMRLQQRVQELLQNRFTVDANRLELEIALLADKLDVTEECVRFRSHNKFFLETLTDDEASGRKLNFLAQEMNREANTIASKAGDAQIAHIAVRIKEELEKIREQLQNIE
jgi:uncharacterized protein (TIGR00255 family)